MRARLVVQAFAKALNGFETDAAWQEKMAEAHARNQWFTPEYIRQSMNQWQLALAEPAVQGWLDSHQWPETPHGKVAGIIMAGNIPLVGMHDLITALCAGYKVLAKCSSDDEVLPKYWIQKASELMPELAGLVEFGDKIKGAEVAIATGSNNSSRYFEYYFRDIPHLLRKNRNSAALLTGNETAEQLLALGHDVFDYFGLGCRNVTHLLLPEGYAFKPLFDAWEQFAEHANHHKYYNNFHYHRALLLMNLDPHMDNGFILLKERADLYSPVGMLNYSFYSNIDEARQTLHQWQSDLQCVVSAVEGIGAIPFGASQCPSMTDYADGVDTAAWLLASA